MASKRDHDHLFKFVLIGDSGVGKSSLLIRFADDAFTDSYITTIGVDFRFKTIETEKKTVKLQIWDTAGQERFRTITSAYYRGADAIIVVYDTCDKESFTHVDDWLAEVNKFVNSSTCKMLIGNKCDNAQERQVSTDEAQSKAKELGISFIETSAKDATNVGDAFEMMAAELVRRRAKEGSQKKGRTADGGVSLTRKQGENGPADGPGACCQR